jgi:hypothetical protein
MHVKLEQCLVPEHSVSVLELLVSNNLLGGFQFVKINKKATTCEAFL